ncbi:CopG family transcriptional regulator [Kribbella antiqua]|nr:CopG family transcriptional regulator [Kribbella antiqua]
MPLKRRTVYIDEADLTLIRQAADRRGISSAEVIREGIHLAALTNRSWDDPLDWPTFEPVAKPHQ